MSIARCPQGHPVIIQAGGSPSGLELAARTADVVFSVVQELNSAKKAYADLKGRMAKYGRSPEQLSVLPGVMPIIGASDAETRLLDLRRGLRGKPRGQLLLERAEIEFCGAGHREPGAEIS